MDETFDEMNAGSFAYIDCQVRISKFEENQIDGDPAKAAINSPLVTGNYGAAAPT